MKRVMFLLLLAMAIVPEVQAQTWPNEPSGSTVINDWNWNSCPGGGWQLAYGCAAIRQDSTAPLSQPNVLRMELNLTNYTGGGDPFIVLPNLREIYFSTWVKLSNPYQGHSNGSNKLIYGGYADGSGLWLQAQGPQWGPWSALIGTQTYNPNLPPTQAWQGGTFVPGRWHRIEVYHKNSSTFSSRDGIFRMWFDGSMIVNVTNANTPQQLTFLSVTPTWDGGEASLPPELRRTNPDQISFDHIRVSTGGSAGTTKGDTTPPAAPAGLRAN